MTSSPESSLRSQTDQFAKSEDDSSAKTGRQVQEQVVEIAGQRGAARVHIALAWLLAQKPWIAPIPASRKLERLDENLGELKVELSAGDLSEIRSAMQQITVVGNRY